MGCGIFRTQIPSDRAFIHAKCAGDLALASFFDGRELPRDLRSGGGRPRARCLFWY